VTQLTSVFKLFPLLQEKKLKRCISAAIEILGRDGTHEPKEGSGSERPGKKENFVLRFLW
jgi:hypothetical protein